MITHQTTPHQTAPNQSRSYRITPHQITPHQTAPHHTIPHHNTTPHITPHHFTPYALLENIYTTSVVKNLAPFDSVQGKTIRKDNPSESPYIVTSFMRCLAFHNHICNYIKIYRYRVLLYLLYVYLNFVQAHTWSCIFLLYRHIKCSSRIIYDYTWRCTCLLTIIRFMKVLYDHT